MKTLQVREVPDGLYSKLAEEAKKEHRSIAQETLMILSKGLHFDLAPRDRRRKVLDRMAKDYEKLKQYNFDDPVKLIREDRQRDEYNFG
jgi:antitoxin FitA